MEAKRDSLYLMIAIFDEFGERGAFGAGGIRKRNNRTLQVKWREREGQVLDHLAPDIEDVRASGFPLEIFLGSSLIDLPRQKRGCYPLRVQNPDYKEVRRAHGSALNGIERQREIAGAARCEDDVPDGKKGWRAFGRQRDPLHFVPVDAAVCIDIPHLDNCDIAAGQFVHGTAKRVSRRDGGNVA